MPNFAMPRSLDGAHLQAIVPDTVATTGTVVGTVGAASARVALPTGAEVVRVACVNDCYVNFGNSGVTAAGTNMLMLKGAEVFKIPTAATHIAFIQHTTGGAITITAAGL